MFKNKYFSFLFYILLIIFLIINSNFVTESIKSALFVCYSSVVPSLFIFMIISSLISSSNAIYVFSIIFYPFLYLLKIKSKEASCYLVLSLFSGFVVGAKFLNNLFKKNYNENSLKILSILFTQNSFSFVILIIGVNVLKNINLSLLIYISLTISSFITAFLFSFILKYDFKDYDTNLKINKYPFSLIIKDNVNAILNICGFVIVFYLVCDFVILYFENEMAKNFILPFLEVTSGIIKSDLNKNPYFIIFALSILPLSTLSQISFFTNGKINIKFLISSRLIHTPLSIFILTSLLNIFPYTENVYNSSSIYLKTTWISADLSLILFIISFLFVIFLEENKRFTNLK